MGSGFAQHPWWLPKSLVVSWWLHPSILGWLLSTFFDLCSLFMKMVASSLNPDVFLRDRVASPSEMTGGGEFVFSCQGVSQVRCDWWKVGMVNCPHHGLNDRATFILCFDHFKANSIFPWPAYLVFFYRQSNRPSPAKTRL